jgi:hypothetical protein
MNQNLAEIFQKKQQQSAGAAGIDWDDRRNKYLAAVDDLYHQIGIILAEPVAQKTVAAQRRAKELSENYIGTYKIDDLILLVGDEQVRFSPVGRNIAGASGRVDVLGERGVPEVLIVQPDGRWSFVQSRQPTLKVVPFDESSLAEVLKRVMRE